MQAAYKDGAAIGNANETILRRTRTAAMALAANFWYESIRYPVTQRISKRAPALKIAAPMFLETRLAQESFWTDASGKTDGMIQCMFVRALQPYQKSPTGTMNDPRMSIGRRNSGLLCPLFL